jgi:hypothetical protein
MIYAGTPTLGALIESLIRISDREILLKFATPQEYNIPVSSSCDWNALETSCPDLWNALISMRQRCILDLHISKSQCEDSHNDLLRAVFEKTHRK